MDIDGNEHDPKFRPDGWEHWDFMAKTEWLVDTSRFSSLSISKYPHDTATKSDFLETRHEYLNPSQIREIYGAGRYDFQVNVKLGGAGARITDFRIGALQPAQVPQPAAPTQYPTGHQANTHSSPSQFQSRDDSQPGGFPSSGGTNEIMMMLLEEIRGKNAPIVDPAMTKEDFERRLADERERYEREREEDRRRFEAEKARESEKAKLEADLANLRIQIESQKNEPMKKLNSDPTFLESMMDRMMKLSTQSQERVTVDESLRNPFAMFDKVQEAAAKLAPNSASTAATVLDGVGKLVEPGMNMLAQMLASKTELEIRLLEMKAEQELRDREWENRRQERVDQEAMARAQYQLGYAPQQAAPVQGATPQSPSLPPIVEKSEETEEQRMAKISRTFLKTLLSLAQENSKAEEGRQHPIATIVDAALAEALMQHASESVVDDLFDCLDPWVYSNINNEGDEKAFMKWFGSKLSVKDSILLGSQRNNPEVRAGAIDYFKEVQSMLQGLKAAQEEVMPRWGEIFTNAGIDLAEA